MTICIILYYIVLSFINFIDTILFYVHDSIAKPISYATEVLDFDDPESMYFVYICIKQIELVSFMFYFRSIFLDTYDV